MSRHPVAALVAGLLLAASCLATTPPAKGAHAKAKKTKTAKPESPKPPPTPEQLPPTLPVVNYSAGRLSILANNSTLASVLDLVRRQTGASIDISSVAPSDRVYVKLGPGAPKDILAALLDGSRFNFAILGSATDPDAVSQVVLLPKSGAGTPVAGSSSPLAPAARAGTPVSQDDEDAAPEDEQPVPVVDEPQPQPVPNQGDPVPPGQPSQPGQVKTPEQLLQELQQMQRQQQQQQPQQNPPPNPNPQDPQ